MMNSSQITYSHYSDCYACFSDAAISRQFGPGSGSIVLDDVRCTGDEVQLTNCSHRGLGVHNCGHNEDVGVTCQGKIFAPITALLCVEQD